MSGSGQSRRFNPLPAISGLPPETDIVRDGRNVSNVPNSEVVRFGVTLIHNVGASPQSHIGRSEN
jgi:hypothetical protein